MASWGRAANRPIDEDEEFIINENEEEEQVEAIDGGVLLTCAQTDVGDESRNVQKRPRSAWMVFFMESSLKLFPAVVEVEKICSYNWAKFVLDWLVKEVKAFRATFSIPNTARGQEKMKSKLLKSGLGGCLLFLMLFYSDRASPAIANVPRETPRLKGWTDELIWRREAEVKSMGFYADDDDDIFGLF